MQATTLTCPPQRSHCSINVEDTLEALHPGHRIAALLKGFVLCTVHFCRLSPLTPFSRCDQGAMLAVRCEKPVKPRQVYPGFRNQGSQA